MDLSLGEPIKLRFIRNKRLDGSLCPPRAHRGKSLLVTATNCDWRPNRHPASVRQRPKAAGFLTQLQILARLFDTETMGSLVTRDLAPAKLQALMRAAQAGDMRAYESVLRIITPKLRQLIRRQRPFFSAEEIEDLVQEILLSVHAVRATYDPNRALMPWVSTIAHSRIVDGARRYYRGKAHEIQMDEYPVTFSNDAANMEIESFGNPEELARAIKSLPSGQRVAIEMLKLREMSLKDAAIASGTSAGALKVSVHRAIVNLRRVLSKE